RRLLRSFFRESRTASRRSAVDQHIYGKLLVVIRSRLFCENIFHRLPAFFLDKFLKDRLAVIKKLFVLHIVQNKFQNKFSCFFKTAVQIDRSQKSLRSVRHDRISHTSSRHIFAPAEKKILRKIKLSGAIGKTGLA